MPLRLSRLSKTFDIEGHTVSVLHEMFVETSRSSLTVDGEVVATDAVKKDDPDRLRNHRLLWALPDGRRLEVEVGPATSWSYGIVARLDGQPVYETHPGRSLGYGPKMQAYVRWAEAQNTPEMQARNAAAWKRNWPSLAVDLSLALVFFFVAREFGLVTAAVGGAAAGLVLWVAQRLTRIDLLGGLAVFGIIMGLLSAGFALIFQDERIVQHRGTVMGVVGALPFLIDGLTGGQRLAARLGRYFAFDIDAGRLGVGMGLIGLASAAMNAAAAVLLSRDAWLVFTTFGDLPITLLLFFVMLGWARKGPAARTY